MECVSLFEPNVNTVIRTGLFTSFSAMMGQRKVAGR